MTGRATPLLLPVLNQPHTYKTDTFLPRSWFREPPFLITRELYLTTDHTTEAPSPRLLGLYRAIGRILHLSAAGDYIDKIFRDMEENGVRAGGSTALDRFVSLSLRGWGNTEAAAHDDR